MATGFPLVAATPDVQDVPLVRRGDAPGMPHPQPPTRDLLDGERAWRATWGRWHADRAGGQ